ncbi:hypothetical protein KJ633_06205 [bacterium]|nr:hypothetical protein [bacterium]
MEGIQNILNIILNNIAGSAGAVSAEAITSGVMLLALILSIAGYSIFIWYFYRFIARRDIIKLDLSKYNKRKFGLLLKLFGFFFYVIEFIIVIPLLVIFWFATFSVLLLFLAKEQAISNILLVAVSVVGAIRVTSYFNEDLSKDLAKMIPFTLLGIAIIAPGFFDFSSTLQKIAEIPSLLNNILIYGVFIIIIEAVFRLMRSVYSWIKPSQDIPDKGAKKTN